MAKGGAGEDDKVDLDSHAECSSNTRCVREGEREVRKGGGRARVLRPGVNNAGQVLRGRWWLATYEAPEPGAKMLARWEERKRGERPRGRNLVGRDADERRMNKREGCWLTDREVVRAMCTECAAASEKQAQAYSLLLKRWWEDRLCEGKRSMQGKWS